LSRVPMIGLMAAPLLLDCKREDLEESSID